MGCGWLSAVAHAQPSSVARIGMVSTGTLFPRHYFDDEMRRLGWVEGQNLVVDWRVTGSDPQARAQIAAEVIASKPDVLVAGSDSDAEPLYALTRSIPLVVIGSSDLVGIGMAKSLARLAAT